MPHLLERRTCDCPYRIGFVRGKVPGGEPRRALMAMNSPSDGKGELIENDIGNGQRLRAIETPEDVSVVWFTPPDDASDPNKTTEIFAALLTHMGSPTPYFAVLSTDGEIICETPMEGSTWGNHTERIVSGDLDGDGKVEWIVPTREGVIWFFEENGSLIDKFALGREVTGAAIANWDDETFLIISHNTGVISYRIERNTDTPKEAATPANTRGITASGRNTTRRRRGILTPSYARRGTASEGKPRRGCPQTEIFRKARIPEQERRHHEKDLTWLSHNAWRLRLGETIFIVDPFFRLPNSQSTTRFRRLCARLTGTPTTCADAEEMLKKNNATLVAWPRLPTGMANTESRRSRR